MPNRTTNIIWILSAIVVVLTFGMLAVHWYHLPAKVPMHFGLNGEVDRYGSRKELLVLPALSLGLYLLFFWISKKTIKINPIKYGAKTPKQVAITKQMMAESTLLTTLLIAFGVFEIMSMAVTYETQLSKHILGFLLLGLGFVFVRYLFRISRVA